MRNLIFGMSILLFSIAFVSCNNDELDNIEKEVTVLQDSIDIINNRHKILLDSVSSIIATLNKGEDVNAIKIEQIGSLFEAIARQPEAAYTLIDANEILYKDYTELLPFSDKTIINRGVAIAELFDALARQPEAYSKLDSAATKYLGLFDATSMSDDYTEGKARGTALAGLFASVARQPEAHGKMDTIANKLIGEYNASYMSNDLLDVSKAFATGSLSESIARQPEADSLLNLICIRYLNFSFINK